MLRWYWNIFEYCVAIVVKVDFVLELCSTLHGLAKLRLITECFVNALPFLPSTYLKFSFSQDR